MINEEFKLGVYQDIIFLLIGNSEEMREELVKICNLDNTDRELMFKIDEIYKRSLDCSGAVNYITNIESGVREYYIWLRDFPKNINDHWWWNVFSHEIMHLTHQILEYRGISLSGATQESYAYLVGYLTEELYKKICEIRRKQKKDAIEKKKAVQQDNKQELSEGLREVSGQRES